ncbi:MAG: ABC transporter ATP-binding protein [Pseudomonadota bacterium]
MPDANPRLEAKGLVRRYGGRAVVHDVDLAVEAGELVCLLGPSGCGKSTSLRMLAGVETPDGGSIWVDGQPVFGPNVMVQPEDRSVGMMFQDFALFPHLSVGANVEFGLRGSKAARRERSEMLLERVALERYYNAFPHELSGGEQQRVALARALAPRPHVMLMDEPFSGLDNRLRDGIRDDTLALLKEEGTAVVMVTHEPEEAMRMADRIALMRDGRIIQQGAPYNLYNSPVDKAAAAFFSDINVIRGQVSGALAQTPFGEFLAPGHADGAHVEIVIRPQHLKVDFHRNGNGPVPTPENGVPAQGKVARSRYLGRESLVEFTMDFNGTALQAVVPGVFLPKPGTPFWLLMRRDRCHVFAADGAERALNLSAAAGGGGQTN